MTTVESTGPALPFDHPDWPPISQTNITPVHIPTPFPFYTALELKRGFRCLPGNPNQRLECKRVVKSPPQDVEKPWKLSNVENVYANPKYSPPAVMAV